MRIFLAPRSNETSYKNFLSTIEGGVDYSVVEPHLTKEGRKLLSGQKKLFAWGTKETIKSSWSKMEKGDLVLFYKGREGDEKEGKFLYAGRLYYKQHSKDLGMALWPPKTGEAPWSCVFFLEELTSIFMPISDLNEMAEYKDNFVIQGFMPLNDKGTKRFINKFGTLEAIVEHYKIEKHKEEDVSDLEEEKNEITAHAEAQLYLLKTGCLLGYDTYAPSNDRSRNAFGEKLKDYCTLKKVPTRFLGDNVSIISQIDVIWFKDDIPKYAFEVEHTTKFNSGFTRLLQLHPMGTRLTIVSSSKNYPLFEKYVDSAAFYRNKKNFFFKTYKQLEMFFKSVSEFEKIRETFLGSA